VIGPLDVRRPDRRRTYADARIWRAVDVYRWLSLLYAVLKFVSARDEYRRPLPAAAVLIAMAAWTGYLQLHRVVLRRPMGRSVLLADLVVSAAAVLSTLLVDDPVRIASGAPTLPTFWAASAVIAWAVADGWRGGLAAALAISAVDLVEIWPHAKAGTIESIVQLVLVGSVIGYAAQLYAAARQDLARAAALEATAREHDRLAGEIHDSVLQVLAYVQRRGAEVGGEAAELGRLAGEQEARLRALIAAVPTGVAAAGEADLRALLAGMGRRGVTVSTPAQAVLLPEPTVDAIGAAVAAALDNVERHAGPATQAWVLLEQEPDVVTVTVRDDGAGIPPGRLEEAAKEGRLGVATCIRGRISDVGGWVDLVSSPGQGTEWEIQVPGAGRP
jgi:signal transduction histidine kinase